MLVVLVVPVLVLVLVPVVPVAPVVLVESEPSLEVVPLVLDKVSTFALVELVPVVPSVEPSAEPVELPEVFVLVPVVSDDVVVMAVESVLEFESEALDEPLPSEVVAEVEFELDEESEFEPEVDWPLEVVVVTEPAVVEAELRPVELLEAIDGCMHRPSATLQTSPWEQSLFCLQTGPEPQPEAKRVSATAAQEIFEEHFMVTCAAE